MTEEIKLELEQKQQKLRSQEVKRTEDKANLQGKQHMMYSNYLLLPRAITVAKP